MIDSLQPLAGCKIGPAACPTAKTSTQQPQHMCRHTLFKHGHVNTQSGCLVHLGKCRVPVCVCNDPDAKASHTQQRMQIKFQPQAGHAVCQQQCDPSHHTDGVSSPLHIAQANCQSNLGAIVGVRCQQLKCCEETGAGCIKPRSQFSQHSAKHHTATRTNTAQPKWAVSRMEWAV